MTVGAPRWAPLPDLTAEELLAHSGRVVGDLALMHGMSMVPVLFAMRSTDRRIAVIIRGLTDHHRHTLEPAILTRRPGTDVMAIALWLPADGVFSYRFADVTDLPDDIGSTRSGWLQVHHLGRPDPAAREVIPTLGGHSSVWTGPTAGVRPWPTDDGEVWKSVPLIDRWIRVLPGDGRVVLLLDGQSWQGLACGTALRSAGHGHTVVLIPSERADRATELTTSQAASRLVLAGLDAAAQVLGRPVRTAFAIAGQSFGGLAVASLAADRPELLESAIVQSPSLWFPNPDKADPGPFLQRIRRGHGAISTPVQVQVGTEEGNMVTLARSYRDALRARGTEVSLREFRGGHDYAWWRHGLVDALSNLD